MISGCNSRI
ncbi:hypothetical protein YPPY96_2737, partial [Yersinia pestis PY-96]